MNELDYVDATVEDMEHALDKLVGEIINLKEHQSSHSAKTTENVLHCRKGPAFTSFKTAMDLIALSPINGALRFSVHQIGQMLFDSLQDQNKMLRVARRVCSLDEANWSNRMTIIDAAWQGIGSDANGYYQ